MRKILKPFKRNARIRSHFLSTSRVRLAVKSYWTPWLLTDTGSASMSLSFLRSFVLFVQNLSKRALNRLTSTTGFGRLFLMLTIRAEK